MHIYSQTFQSRQLPAHQKSLDTSRFQGGRAPSPVPSINRDTNPKEASRILDKLWGAVVKATKENLAPSLEENAIYKNARSRYDRNREKARPILENQPVPRPRPESSLETTELPVTSSFKNTRDPWATLGDRRRQ